MYTILAIDPGGTTGWARYQAERMVNPFNQEETFYNEHWLSGQMGPQDHHEQLYGFLEDCHTHEYTIICERFDFRGDDRSDINLMAREYIGVVKLFAEQRGVDVVWQWPFQGVGKKSFVQPEHLRSMGLWVTGGSQEWVHAMDAYRHLLFYMATVQRRVDILKRMGK